MLWELPVLEELAVQLAGSVPTEQKVHLARAQRVRLVVLERLVSLVQVQPVLREQKVRWEHRKWGRRQAGQARWTPQPSGGAPGWRGRPWGGAQAGCRPHRGK